MTSSTSLQNSPKEEITAWVEAFHRAADSLTTTDLHKFYTKDASLKFANNDLLESLDAISAFFDGTFPLLESMKHDIIQLDIINNKIYQPCTITYIIKGDPEHKAIEVPAMGVYHLTSEGDFRAEEPVLKHFDVYLDGNEVWTTMGKVAALKAQGEGK